MEVLFAVIFILLGVYAIRCGWRLIVNTIKWIAGKSTDSKTSD